MTSGPVFSKPSRLPASPPFRLVLSFGAAITNDSDVLVLVQFDPARD
jgi:hypothetical protein